MLGPPLFVNYINTLADNVANMVSNYADYTKMCGVGNNKEVYLSLQQSQDELGK